MASCYQTKRKRKMGGEGGKTTGKRGKRGKG
jgi:hypothetical protein